MATDGIPPKTLPQLPPDQVMLAALADPRVARVYGNQFFTFIGSHDITLMFGVNTVPTAIASLSYPLAKTLGQNLLNAVADYERQTGQTVADTAALDAALKR